MRIHRGDVAIITGASRGLGVHIARALAKKGMSLVLAARSAQGLDAVAQELRSLGVEVLEVPTDMARSSMLVSLVEAALARFGRVDVLVNNAGFAYALPFDRVELADIEHMLAVNLAAPIALSRLVLPHMIANGRGHIVNIASLAGLLPTPYEELYTATKHGLVGFTRSLRASAQDQRWPVSASTICPGLMDGAGIFEDFKNTYGVKAPSALGSVRVEALGEEVIRAIEQEAPDALITKGPIRLSAAMLALAPRCFEWLSTRMQTATMFRVVGAEHARERVQRSQASGRGRVATSPIPSNQ